jgi:hypothetical protein
MEAASRKWAAPEGVNSVVGPMCRRSPAPDPRAGWPWSSLPAGSILSGPEAPPSSASPLSSLSAPFSLRSARSEANGGRRRRKLLSQPWFAVCGGRGAAPVGGGPIQWGCITEGTSPLPLDLLLKRFLVLIPVFLAGFAGLGTLIHSCSLP